MSGNEEPTATDSERVSAALDALLVTNDPGTMTVAELRGAVFDAGLAWVHFAYGDGGMAARPELNRLVHDRLRAAGAPPGWRPDFIELAGPTIATHGSEAVKRRFLRPMFTGAERWCQLFSEPGAGSDFAGLSTRAELDGDEWIVNGQKVWTTMAHLSDFGMMVTRTDPEARKHQGLTYFALDMRAPGVDVRPLRQMTGDAEFNEVYLTDVRVPDAHRIGAAGDGWRVSLTTLMNERNAIGEAFDVGGASLRGGVVNDGVSLWRELEPEDRRPADRDKLMALWVRAEVARLTNLRASQNARVGNPGPEMSIAKLAFSELNKALYEFTTDLMGPHGLIGYDYTYRRPGRVAVRFSDEGLRHAFLRVRANTIEGGTSEIMRNIIGEQVLGLPGEPRVDKDVPWRSIPRN